MRFHSVAKTLAFSVLSVAAFSAHADVVSDTATLVERDLSKLVSSTSQEMHLYQAVANTVISTDATPIAPEDPRVLSYLEKLAVTPNYTSGKGAFFSVDPATALNLLAPLPASWVLIQAVVPAGTKFLDETKTLGFQTDTLTALQASSCYFYSIPSFASSTTTVCAQIWTKVISDLGVSAYRNAGSNANFDFCTSHVDAGFYLLNDLAINPSRVVAFSSDLPAQSDSHSENRLIIHELLKHTTSNPALAATVWPTLQGTPTTDVGTWGKSELYDCGKSLMQIFTEEVKPVVKTFTRDVNVYHWAPRSKVTKSTGLMDGQDIDFKNYANYVISSFFDATLSGGNMAGPGLYAAIDPTTTAGYGNMDGLNDPVMLQIIFPKGMKFLDDGHSQQFSSSLSTMLSAQGCYASTLTGIFSNISPACKTIRDQIVAQYDFSALRYVYAGATYPNCPGRLGDAFVIKDYGIINSGRMVGFTHDLPATPDLHSENRLIIDQLFSLANYYQAHPWPALVGQKPVTDVPNWMKDNLMGCGSYAEDL